MISQSKRVKCAKKYREPEPSYEAKLYPSGYDSATNLDINSVTHSA